MRWRILLLTAGLAVLSGPPGTAEEGGALRSWTNETGAVIRARMQGVDGEAVELVLADGKKTSYPLARLSEADRDFVRAEGWPLPRPWAGWPEDLLVTLANTGVESVGQVDGRFTYRSDHFEIIAEEELATPAVTHVARALEGIYQLLATSPWEIQARPEKGRFPVQLFASRDSYIKNGGPPNTAGVYKVREKVFLVPFESIGLRRTNTGWKSNDEFSTATIVHELTHMLMAEVIDVLPPWLVEGAAEYMSLMPMRTSVFRPRSITKEIQARHEFLNTRVRGGGAAPLAPVFRLSLEEWQSGNLPGGGASPGQISGFYHAGLLLTYYFIHLDGRGDGARLQRFLAAAHHNKERLARFEREYTAYRKAWAAFAKLPGVEEIGPGQLRYPEELEPPKAPQLPFGEAEGEPQRFQEYEILLDGRTEEELMREAVEALRGLDFVVRE